MQRVGANGVSLALASSIGAIGAIGGNRCIMGLYLNSDWQITIDWSGSPSLLWTLVAHLLGTPMVSKGEASVLKYSSFDARRERGLARWLGASSTSSHYWPVWTVVAQTFQSLPCKTEAVCPIFFFSLCMRVPELCVIGYQSASCNISSCSLFT